MKKWGNLVRVPDAAAKFAAEAGITRVAWILTFGAFLKFSANCTYPFTALYLQRSLGAPMREIGWVLAVLPCGMLIGSPILGLAIDRFGARRVLPVCVLLQAGAMLVLALPRSLGAFAAVSFLVGFLSAGFRPGYQNLIAQLCADRETPAAVSLFLTAMYAGMGLSAALGGIVFATQMSLIFVIDAAVNVVCVLYLIGMPLVLAAVGAGERARDLVGTKDARTIEHPPARHWRDGGFFAICACVFLADSVRAQTLSTFPIYMTGVYGLTPSQLGLLLGTGGFTLALTGVPAVTLAKAVDRRSAAAAGVVCMCAVYCVFPLTRSFPAALILVAVSAIGQALLYPTLVAMILERAPVDKRGMYLSLFYATAAFAQVLFTGIGGDVYERLGPDVFWFACSTVGLLAATPMFVWRRLDSRSNAPTSRHRDDATTARGGKEQLLGP